QWLEHKKHHEEKAVIEEIFRAAHTLKGMAATMGYTDLSDVTHHLENVFDNIRYDKINVQPSMVDVLFETVDYLNEIVEDISNGGEGKRDVTSILEKIAKLESNSDPTIDEGTEQVENVSIDTSDELKHVEEVDEFELTILKESMERGFNNYEIHIELSKECLLKGARVFMVFEVLEQFGEVI